MSAYALGVDLGTTYSAAAIGRGSQVNTLQLGTDGAAVPSVVVVREDGEVLVGDAAERRATAEPARSAREFKRRLGDPVPLIVGDQPYPVEQLMGYQLGDIVRRATEQEGEPPSVVVLTHPANYTEFKLDKLRAVADHAGLDPARVKLLAEPEAAAISYTRDQKLEVGEVIAVYDFGGGTFDAALVRKAATGFELIGVPEGMERLGGIDFDQAVLAHVDSSVDGLVTGADRSDPATLPAQARLRVDCRRAKEALSTDGDTTIAVSLPGLQTEVRLTRAEFEAMVRPRIAQTVTALERTVASAGLTMDDVSRILLVGGTSRMPVVGEMIRSATGRPVGLDTHPKLAIATGAALAGGSDVVAPKDEVAADWQTPTRLAPAAAATSPRPGGKKTLIIVVAAAAVGLIGVLGFVALSGGSDDPSTTAAPGLPAQGTAVVPPATAPATTPATTPAEEPAESTPQTTATTSPEEPAPAEGGVVEAVAALPAPAVGIALESGDVIAVLTDSSAVRVGADGSVVALGTVTGAAGGVAVAPDGEIVVSTPAGVQRVADGTLLLDGAAVGLGATPGPVAFDGVGNLYVADNDNGRVIRQGTDGALSLVAGDGSTPNGVPVDGVAVEVAVGRVTGLALDGTGRLLIGDDGTAAVRAVSADGSIATIVGGGSVPVGQTVGPVEASPTELALGGISGLAVDGAGAIAISDDVEGVILVAGADGAVTVAIARNPAVSPPADGVPAGQSTVGPIGPVGLERSGVVLFTDAGTLRRIGES